MPRSIVLPTHGKHPNASYARIFDYAAQPKVTRTHCPVCEAPVERVMHGLQDRFGFRISVVTCESCGHAFLLENLTREGYAQFYGGEASPYRRLVWCQRHLPGVPYDMRADAARLIKVQRQYADKLLSWEPLCQALASMTTVLDAGGSTGTVAQMLAPRAALTVLDPSPSELNARPAGIAAIHGFLEDPIPTRQIFDGILFCETVDHLVDPVAALRNVYNVSVPGGVMYIDYVVKTGFKVDHPSYFDERSFRTLLMKTGWKLDDRNGGEKHVGYLCHRP